LYWQHAEMNHFMIPMTSETKEKMFYSNDVRDE